MHLSMEFMLLFGVVTARRIEVPYTVAVVPAQLDIRLTGLDELET